MTRDDNITYVQTVSDGNGMTTTVVAGLVRGERITRYIVRSLVPAALDTFERDLDVALDRGEDPELTIAAWAAVQ